MVLVYKKCLPILIWRQETTIFIYLLYFYYLFVSTRKNVGTERRFSRGPTPNWGAYPHTDCTTSGLTGLYHDNPTYGSHFSLYVFKYLLFYLFNYVFLVCCRSMQLKICSWYKWKYWVIREQSMFREQLTSMLRAVCDWALKGGEIKHLKHETWSGKSRLLSVSANEK